MPADPVGAGAPQGLTWSWALDFDTLARCIGDDGSSNDGSGGSPDGGPGDEEATQQAVLDAVAEHGGERIPAGALAGQIAEQLPPGPDAAAWLAITAVTDLKDYDLAAAAGSWRRISSWAQAQELAAVAQIVSRAAAREKDIGTGEDGRPARIPASATAEVSLELTMSQCGAAWWTDLAVDLAWRLAATGAALAAGKIDLARARLIAEATRMLSDEAARAVEGRVLPTAGDKTTSALRAVLRREVIIADPEGAERRRKETERLAKVSLYPDEETTSTLTGQRLPTIHAAAAMARIRGMARAMKAAGVPGTIDLLSAQIYLGLLLGTMPLIPPAEGAPPDPPGDSGGEGPDDRPGKNPPGGGPPRGNPDAAGPGNPDAAGPGASTSRGSRRDGRPRDSSQGDNVPRDNVLRDNVRDDDVPPPGDADAPREDEDCPCPDNNRAGSGWGGPGQDDDDDDGRPGNGPAPDWPDVPAGIPPAFAPPGDRQPGDGRSPAGGMLDVSMPWQTLAGISPSPGRLGRIGPVTAIQARRLAELAARNPAAEWRIIVTTPAGHAMAVTRIPRPRNRDGPLEFAPGIGLVSRVTLTIPEDILAQPPPPGPPPLRAGPDPPAGILARALRAAAVAADRARAGAQGDAAAGGCAHKSASSAYRPPPRLKDYIAARDLTCRYPTCGRPAWRGDLDHTIPFEKSHLTCRCNLGGLCRTHHIIKQHLCWSLHQTAPGIFQWTTPAGLTFTVTPDVHPM
jgi:Domain of unknown function (DUF222)